MTKLTDSIVIEEFLQSNNRLIPNICHFKRSNFDWRILPEFCHLWLNICSADKVVSSTRTTSWGVNGFTAKIGTPPPPSKSRPPIFVQIFQKSSNCSDHIFIKGIDKWVDFQVVIFNRQLISFPWQFEALDSPATRFERKFFKRSVKTEMIFWRHCFSQSTNEFSWGFLSWPLKWGQVNYFVESQIRA